MAYQVRLSQFEGPLDLLLHLIRRDKIDIYDIPISHITHEYLSYIDIMQELELELAGKFFVMAATLMRIKAQMLLPRRSNAEKEEEEDPRDELVRNLIEYKKYKEAAQHMAEMENDRRRVFTRPTAAFISNDEEEPALELTVFDLLGAFKKVFDELKKQVSYRISKESVTVEDKIEIIRSNLSSRGEVLFTELFEGDFSKLDIIVTFLAVLEMVRLGELLARQMTKGHDIWLYSPAEKPRMEAEEGVHERNEQP